MWDAIIPASSMRPMPKPSTPMLLLIVRRPLTPFGTRAAIKLAGMPHNPKPPTITVAPSGMSATAASGVAITLSTHASRLVDDEFWFSSFLHVVDRYVRSDFFQHQA